jgi:hypothetical protein
MIRATIYLALVCLAWRLASELRPARFGRDWHRLRAIWSLGCVAFVAHVCSAFHWKHDWSHADAIRVTAERTYEMMGFRFGEGLYFSYLFLLLWIIDVLWMWLAESAYRARSPWLTRMLLSYLAFIAFNGAVIFESHVTRWVGLPISIVLLYWCCVPNHRAIMLNKRRVETN